MQLIHGHFRCFLLCLRSRILINWSYLDLARKKMNGTNLILCAPHAKVSLVRVYVLFLFCVQALYVRYLTEVDSESLIL